jgi:hypothetical protein
MIWWLCFLGVVLAVSAVAIFIGGRGMLRLASRPRGVFISYSGKDREEANTIRTKLEQHGYVVRMYDPENLWPSAWSGMACSLRDAHAVLLLQPKDTAGLSEHPTKVSNDAMGPFKTTSLYINAELELAQRLGRPVFRLNSVEDLVNGSVDLKNIRYSERVVSEEQAIIIAGNIFKKYFPSENVTDRQLTIDKLTGDVIDSEQTLFSILVCCGIIVSILIIIVFIISISAYIIYLFLKY